MKKLISILLILLFGMSQHINAKIISGSYNNNKLYWSFNDETGQLTVSGMGNMPDHNIPWSNYSNQIKSVVISSGITGIGRWIFRLNESITSVTIPEGVTFIGDAAFFGCKSLESVELPKSVTRLDNAAFGGCSFSSFTIPEGITSIPTNLFQGCNLLTSIVIPEGVTSIGSNAFSGCPLSKLELPSTIESIDNAFDQSAVLKCKNPVPPQLSIGNIKLIVEVPSGYTSVYKETHPWSNAIIIDGTEPQINVNVSTSGTLSEGILKQTDYLRNVYHLTISGSLNDVDLDHIKNSLPNLLTIDMENTDIEEIPNGLCQNKPILNILLPKDLKKIGNYAFQNCSLLDSIIIPDNVTELWGECFEGCKSLKYIEFSRQLNFIDVDVFNSCHSLEEVRLPDGLIQIGHHAFHNCGALRKIYIPASVTNWIGRTYHNRGNNFSSCPKLTEVILAEGLRTLGESVFNSCTNLKEITLPSTLESCEGNPFIGCSQLSKITCMSIFPPVVSTVFTADDWNKDITRSLYVPKWVVNQYKQATGWTSFHEILPLEDVYPESINVTNSQTLTLSVNDLPTDYTPNLIINKGNTNGKYGNLHLKGEGTIPLNNFEIEYTYEDYSPAFINDVAVTVDSIVTHLHTEKGQWEFLSFPYDIRVSDIMTEGDWVIRYYDGEARANSKFTNTWVTVPYDGILHAGEGYIWSGSDGEFVVPSLDNQNKANMFTIGTYYKELKEYIAENTSHSSWNLIGNPYPCYYDTRFMEYTAPITVWNRSKRTYEAYSPVDDAYILRPFEAFFVQCPGGVSSIGYKSSGRQIDTNVRELSNEASIVYTRAKDETSRQVINLTLSDGTNSDRTRLVINSEALIEYEIERDAAKFMSTDVRIPQIFTVEGNNNYAINERPLLNGQVEVGIYAGNKGTYTFALETVSSLPVFLIDHLTGVKVDLSNQSYSFETESGITNGRFSLQIGGHITSVNEFDEDKQINVVSTAEGITVFSQKEVNVTLYNMAGLQIATAQGTSVKLNVAPGLYVVKVGAVSYKVSVTK